MKRWIRLAVAITAVAVLVVLLLPAGVAAGDVAQFRGVTAQGALSNVSPDGCVQTSTSLFLTDEWNHTPPGAPTEQISAFVEVTQIDACNADETLHAISGWTSDLTFRSEPTLRGATLVATFSGLVDTVTGSTVTLTAKVIRKGAGDLTVSRGHEVIDTSTGKINVRTTYSERSSTLAGIVSDGVNEYGGSGGGFLGMTETGSVSVNA